MRIVLGEVAEARKDIISPLLRVFIDFYETILHEITWKVSPHTHKMETL